MNDNILTSNFKDYVPVAADRGHGSMQLASYFELFLLQRFDVPPPRLSSIFPFIVHKRCTENDRKEMKFNDSHTFLSSDLVCLTPKCLFITTF
jgi:hypothetical protein